MQLPANLREVTQDHFERLVADAVRESAHLDLKRELPTSWTNDAKHELLADVTSFANAGGGDIVFGVEEDGQGQAKSLYPLSIVNADQEVRRIQDIILNTAEPRVPGIQLHPVRLSIDGNDGFGLIIRVPQSWVGPHRVRTNQHFFVRDGLRKRQLDIPEIRSLFLRSDSQVQRVRDFRTQRLGLIVSGDVPQRLVDGPILVAHLVPIQAALGLVQIDPVPYTTNRYLKIIGDDSPTSARLNFDGALATRREGAHGQAEGYSQLFRSGFFESACVLVRRNPDGRFALPSTWFEINVISLLKKFRQELEFFEISTECAVMLSLVRANEVRLGVSGEDFFEPHQTIFDRNIIALPDVVVSIDSTPERALKPAFDLMWQAAGLSGSRNYNHTGDRVSS